MITLEVDGQPAEARPGETILAVLQRAGVHVPTLCHMPQLTPSGACRMCIVEVDGQRLVSSCSFPAAAGMKVKTRTPRVLQARKTIVELLLRNHPDDCLYCVRGGKCDLQKLAGDLGVRQRVLPRSPQSAARNTGAPTGDPSSRGRKSLDVSSPSIVRDPAKCVLCGRCVRMCEEIQSVAAVDFIGRGSRTVVGTALNQGLNVSTCVNCGQCILVCPTGALSERSHLSEVMAALADPAKTVVVQHAPAVSVSLAEEAGLFEKPGKDVDGKMVAALKRIGFDWVFDTSFAADLTIMEEASELAHRIGTGGQPAGVLPLLTSCSPGWIKFVEHFYPDFLGNLSTCKSPQQMMGALIKSLFCQRQNLDPAQIVSVSIMPCTAKKFEAARPEMASGGNRVGQLGQAAPPDVDYVLTTRELGQLFRMFGIDLAAMEPASADTPFGERSTAGKIFGASGGVMEAAIRTAHFLLTGKELADLTIQPLRGPDGIKELHVEIGGRQIGAAAVSGLGNARKLLDQLRAGRKDLHFIEVMTCPGGCIAGGGQPLGADPAALNAAVRARMEALYRIDRAADEPVRVSHRNQWVQRLYQEFLGKPLGETSHRLLHTHYQRRGISG